MMDRATFYRTLKDPSWFHRWMSYAFAAILFFFGAKFMLIAATPDPSTVYRNNPSTFWLSLLSGGTSMVVAILAVRRVAKNYRIHTHGFTRHTNEPDAILKELVTGLGGSLANEQSGYLQFTFPRFWFSEVLLSIVVHDEGIMYNAMTVRSYHRGFVGIWDLGTAQKVLDRFKAEVQREL